MKKNRLHFAANRKTGNKCPRCGAPLIWNVTKSTEYCKAPNQKDPLRVCGYTKFIVIHYSQKDGG